MNYIQNEITFFGNQNRAFEFILRCNVIRLERDQPNHYQEGFIIIGPPGTGKSFIICTGLLGFLSIRDQNRGGRRRRTQVAIGTFTNAAADRLLEAFESIFSDTSIPVPNRSRLVRRIYSNDAHPVLIDDPRYRDYYIQTSKPSNVTIEEWTELKREIDCTRIFVGTIYAINQCLNENDAVHRLKPIQAEVLMFDEASQINITKFNLAVHRAGNRLHTIGLVGDPAQLSPIASIIDLREDIISKLRFDNTITRITQLNYQKRMHPVIRRLSEIFGQYDEPIIDDPNTELNDLGEIDQDLQLPEDFNQILDIDKRIILLDDSSNQNALETTIGSSRINLFEAQISVLLAKLFMKKYPNLNHDDIIIIVPYTQQADHLKRSGFRCGTVDKFQGQESKLVIASTTRTDLGNVNFVADNNRLNVLISRAKAKLVIINHVETFQTNPLFIALYEYIEKNQEECLKIDLNQGLESLIRLYGEIDN